MMRELLAILVIFLLWWATLTWPGSVTLSWVNPTTLINDEPLPDLAGARISYGPAPGQYTDEVDVGLSTGAALSGLTPGQQLFFAVRAYRSNGVLSAYSSEVSKVIELESEDVTPPTVEILSPPPGTVRRRSTITLAMSALDDVGVEYQRLWVTRGVEIVHECEQEASCTWVVPSANKASYVVHAEAIDAAGNVGEAPTVMVTAR